MNTARLAKLLRERHPAWALHAVGGAHLGGEALKSPGGKWIGDTGGLSGIGIYASIRKIPRARRISRAMRSFVRDHKIDAVVLCDWGAFNCSQLHFFKKQGVPVLYYFPPRSWQRVGSGGLGIANQVDRVATPFEWSAQRLVEAGCRAEWVGHPMLEVKHDPGQRPGLRSEFGASPDGKLVALLPGSRLEEIICLAPRMAAAAAILREKTPGTNFVAAVAEERAPLVKRYLPDWVKIVTGRTADVLYACDAAVVKSGTATLEAAVIGAPHIIVYDVPWIGRIEWVLLWMWKKNIPFIGMPNVILQRLAVPELLGLECTPENIARDIAALLQDESKRARMEEDFREIRDRLGASLPRPATLRTAMILEELLAEKNPDAGAAALLESVQRD
jgi:lipid-A-disaccharide synthase